MFWIALAILFAFQIVNIIENLRDRKSVAGPVINIVLLIVAGLAGGMNQP